METEISSLKEIKLNSSIDIKVSSSIDSFSCEQSVDGDLKLLSPSPPSLTLLKYFNLKILNNGDKDFIRCESEANVFWLIGCSYGFGKIFPEIICLDNKPDFVSYVEFYISVFSPAFKKDESFERNFLFKIKDTEYCLEIINFIGSDGCNETKIRVSRNNSVLGFSEIRVIANNVRIFFHLLFAIPVLIDNIWLVDCDGVKSSTYIHL